MNQDAKAFQINDGGVLLAALDMYIDHMKSCDTHASQLAAKSGAAPDGQYAAAAAIAIRLRERLGNGRR